jgi:hypothetical protein
MEAPRNNTSHGTEHEQLENNLNFCRESIIYKVTGITKQNGVKRLGPTATSVLGVLRHLTEVEFWWFQVNFAGIENLDVRYSEANPNGDFDVYETDTVDSLLDGYKAACENSRKICEGKNLDQLASELSPGPGVRPSLRWIYLRMIAETARHAGHLDIYRELLDGTHDGTIG